MGAPIDAAYFARKIEQILGFTAPELMAEKLADLVALAARDSADAERSRVVAWLRSKASTGSDYDLAALFIEAGEHAREGGT
jgi:hypothetical protein